MRILILGSDINYNLEHYAYMNLNRLGHEVVFYGYRSKLGRLANAVRIMITRSKSIRRVANIIWLNRINEDIRKKAESLMPNLVISIKGEAVTTSTVEWLNDSIGAKTALWYPDDPRYFKGLVRYIAPYYDHIFTASERAIGSYEQIGCKNVHFLPFACEKSVHRRVELNQEERKRFKAVVVFVGTYTPRRARLIKVLERAGIKVGVFGPYWRYFKRSNNVHDGIYGPDMVKAFNAAKIVLNIHVEEDLAYKVNMRTFEATGSGAFLLTDNTYGIEAMFKVGEELVVYNNEEELVELAKYYLKAEELRRRVLQKGQETAYRKHTYQQRLERLVELLV